MDSHDGGRELENVSPSAEAVEAQPSKIDATMTSSLKAADEASSDLRASIDQWLELAGPVLGELEAASTLTQRDFSVRINST